MVIQPQITLVLDNIRSAHNVGSIFRTAECAGVKSIFLCGCTPCPVDRFGRNRPDIAKTALGAETTIPWTYFETTHSAIEKLKVQDFTIVALEQDERAIDYRTVQLSKDIGLIVGNEVDGISRDILDLTDEIVYIPMYGTKESLNVSVATGVALFRFIK